MHSVETNHSNLIVSLVYSAIELPIILWTQPNRVFVLDWELNKLEVFLTNYESFAIRAKARDLCVELSAYDR